MAKTVSEKTGLTSAIESALPEKVGVHRLLKRNEKIEQIQEQKGDLLRKLNQCTRERAQREDEVKTLMSTTEETLTNMEKQTEQFSRIIELLT